MIMPSRGASSTAFVSILKASSMFMFWSTQE